MAVRRCGALLRLRPDFHGDRPQYIPFTEGIEAAWLARSERYADACQENAPELLPNMSTVETVRDMDLIRQALGVEQINYYGFSYGTYLGQV